MQKNYQKDKNPFYPLSRENLHAYSRFLHNKAPLNRYFREKIPYKTIMIAFLFLALGILMFYMGVCELLAGDSSAALERFVLGGILFIPGSYHSFLAVMVLRGVAGYTYEHLTVFESDDWHNNND